MRLEEAKQVLTDALLSGATAIALTAREEEAAQVVLIALGTPTPEDREAAHLFRIQAKNEAECGETKRAARYRRAADALERSPAAIRRAALEEAARAVEHTLVVQNKHYPAADDGSATLTAAAKAIRALDGGASPRELATPATPSPATPLPD